MNADDEAILSALLDGELDPGQRPRVEAAMFADPVLAEHFRELTAVHDLVAGLSRPDAPADLAAAVLARIEREGRPGLGLGLGRLFAAATGTRAARVGALVSAAAALLACAAVGIDRLGHLARDRGVAAAPPAEAPAAVKVVSTPTGPRPRPGPAPSTAAVAAGTDLVKSPDPGPDRAEARAARKILESPNFRTLVIVTGAPGGDADRRVAEILRTAPRGKARSEFGRIVVKKGVVPDPDLPGEGVVFAVVMTEPEMSEFRERLAGGFGKAVEVTAPRPWLVAKLSAVGQLGLERGTPVAELRPPRSLRPEESARVLLKTNTGPEKVVLGQVRPGTGAKSDPLQDPTNRVGGHETEVVVTPREAPTPEQNRSGPHPSNRPPHDAVEPDPADKEKGRPEAGESPAVGRPVESLVLVWVRSR